ncbi:hypothetical protein BH24ACT9_BH24ACT9_10560 [soil metagenome]
MLEAGIGDLTIADRQGIIHSGRSDLNPAKAEIADLTNKAGHTGSFIDSMAGADVLVGLSGGQIPESAIASMAPHALIFSLANPTPEVDPIMAARYAAVVATGRSDLPNQINNVLAFPGDFKGAFDAHATAITERMELATAGALGDVFGPDARRDYVIPNPLDPRVVPAVSEAVAAAARVEVVTAE